MVKNRPGCKFARVTPGRCRAERLELRGGGEAQAVSTGTRDWRGHGPACGEAAYTVQRCRAAARACRQLLDLYYSALKLHDCFKLPKS